MELRTADHRDHALQWHIPLPHRSHPRDGRGDRHDPQDDEDEDFVCLACVVQLLEAGEEGAMLSVRQEHVLGELLRLLRLAKPRVLQLLCEDQRVAMHTLMVLLGKSTAHLHPEIHKPHRTHHWQIHGSHLK